MRLFNVCFREGTVPLEWKSACVVPLYKGKGDKFECGSFRGISLLSVVGKVYGRVLIERIRCGTESMVGEEQSGFRRGRGCMDQVFVVRQVCEKYLRKGKEVFWAFMDLEKAYDRVDRQALGDPADHVMGGGPAVRHRQPVPGHQLQAVLGGELLVVINSAISDILSFKMGIIYSLCVDVMPLCNPSVPRL